MSSTNSSVPIQPVPRTPLSAGGVGIPWAWLEWFNSIQEATATIAMNGAAISASETNVAALTTQLAALSRQVGGAALLGGSNDFTGKNTFESTLTLAVAPVFGDAAGTRLALGLGSAATMPASAFLPADTVLPTGGGGGGGGTTLTIADTDSALLASLPMSVTGTEMSFNWALGNGPAITTFEVSSPSSGPLNSATNGGVYNAWDVNPYAQPDFASHTYTAYLSTDPALWANANMGTEAIWQQINWLLNNKQGYSGTLSVSIADILNIIWTLLGPDAGPDYTTFLNAADMAQLTTDMGTYGPGFVPSQPGQIIGIVLYSAGMVDNITSGAPSATVSNVLVEYAFSPVASSITSGALSTTIAGRLHNVAYTDQMNVFGNGARQVFRNNGAVPALNIAPCWSSPSDLNIGDLWTDPNGRLWTYGEGSTQSYVFTSDLANVDFTLITMQGTTPPGLGFTSSECLLWYDETNMVLSCGNEVGVLSNTVVPATAATSQWVNGLTAAGALTFAQPACSDLSGNLALGQMPTAGATGTITIPKLTTSNGSITVQNGVITGFVNPT